jgi:hypothetical protein
LVVVERLLLFLFCCLLRLLRFLRFLGHVPLHNPKLNASRQSTGIDPGYTEIAKLILHASKKVNAVATRDRTKASCDAWIQRVCWIKTGRSYSCVVGDEADGSETKQKAKT